MVDRVAQMLRRQIGGDGLAQKLVRRHCLVQSLAPKPLGMGEPSSAEIDDATVFFKQFAKALDDHVRGRTFLVGDSP